MMLLYCEHIYTVLRKVDTEACIVAVQPAFLYKVLSCVCVCVCVFVCARMLVLMSFHSYIIFNQLTDFLVTSNFFQGHFSVPCETRIWHSREIYV
jgi:hypothetical protein